MTPDRGEDSDTPEQGSLQTESLKTSIKPNKHRGKVNTCVFTQALTVVTMENTTPTPHIPRKGDEKTIQASLRKILLGVPYIVLFGAIIPTWILSYFDYGIDIVTVFSVHFCASLLLFVGAIAEGFTFTETLKKVDREDESIVLRLRRYAVRGVLRAFLVMLLFGALGYDVGFMHTVLAYVAPMFVVRFGRLALQKKIGKPTLASSLLHVPAGRQS